MAKAFGVRFRSLLAAAAFLTAFAAAGARPAEASLILTASAPGEVYAGIVFDTEDNPVTTLVNLAPSLDFSQVEWFDGDTAASVGTSTVVNAETLIPGSFPAQYLFGTPDFVQLSVVFFDFANSTLSPELLFAVPGYAVAVNAVTDPALVAAQDGFIAYFLYVTTVESGEFSVALFELLGADDVINAPAVPEPASFLLLGTGIAAVVLHRRRQRRTSSPS